MGLWKTRFFPEDAGKSHVGNAVDIFPKKKGVIHTIPAANIFHKLSLWIPQQGVDGCGKRGPPPSMPGSGRMR